MAAAARMPRVDAVGGSAAGNALVTIMGVGALYVFFANGVTWALGCNRAAAEAALEGELPRAFAIESRTRGTPIGAAVLMGLVSTSVLLLYGLQSGSTSDLFWDLFASSAVLFLLPYLGAIASFLYMRISRAGKDSRFDNIKNRPPRFFLAWTLQGLWVLLTAACALAIITGGNREPLGIIGYVGIAVWAAGILIEDTPAGLTVRATAGEASLTTAAR